MNESQRTRPPFAEHASVVTAHAHALKLAASGLPFSIIGPTGSGRATLAEECASARSAAFGSRTAVVRIRTTADVLGLGESPASPVILVADVEPLELPAQSILASWIRVRRIQPIFVGLPSVDDPEHPSGMTGTLRALVAATVKLPALIDRGDDLLRWSDLLLHRACAEAKTPQRSLTAEARSAIRFHAWPGNLHELDSRFRKAVALSDNLALSPHDLGLAHPATAKPFKSLSEAVDEFKRTYIAKALSRADGNRTQAAKLLGVDVRTIFRFLESKQ